MHQVTIIPAGGIDPGLLADLRVAAMRPSLEAVGRFDPVRARQRFLAQYTAEDTWLLQGSVLGATALAGFYVLRLRPDHLYLDHLYIHPDHQALGLGKRVVRAVQAQAAEQGLPLRLMALRDSPANAFYRACGFIPTKVDPLDTHYVWHPEAAARA